MNGYRKSDISIVPKIVSNKPQKGAERKEGSDTPKENGRQRNMLRTQGRESMQNKLQLIHQRAKADKTMKFTALMHHIYNVDMLRWSYYEINKYATAGIDKVTWQEYGMGLEDNLLDLSTRLKSGAYKAKFVKRVFIPKADGKQRPLGVTILEDKIVQRATVAVLNTIYEADFLGFSYGFRPKKSQHQALDALYIGITTKEINYIFDADIRDFFNKIESG